MRSFARGWKSLSTWPCQSCVRFCSAVCRGESVELVELELVAELLLLPPPDPDAIAATMPAVSNRGTATAAATLGHSRRGRRRGGGVARPRRGLRRRLTMLAEVIRNRAAPACRRPQGGPRTS